MESQPQNPEFSVNSENFHIQNFLILNLRNSSFKTCLQKSIISSLND